MDAKNKLAEWRKFITQPLVAGVVCSLLALPARVVGHEVAQAFRRSVDYVISKSDTLFELVTHSQSAADMARAGQAWGAWILYGLVTALVAMAIMRWLTSGALAWISIAIVGAVWIGIYFLVWNWDAELEFALSAFQPGGTGRVWGPWPLAGSFGFFSGFIPGLVIAAMPWRSRMS